MRYWLQYHNFDRLGYLPSGYELDVAELSTLDTSEFEASCISTNKQMVCDAVDDVVFMIVGYGTKPKRYLLWSWLLVEGVEEGDDMAFDAYGTGRVLNPPPELSGHQFEKFKKQNGNFGLGFRQVTNLPFLPCIVSLAKRFGRFGGKTRKGKRKVGSAKRTKPS